MDLEQSRDLSTEVQMLGTQLEQFNRESNLVAAPARQELTAIWDDVSPLLRRMFPAVGATDIDVDDLLQDVYLKALQKLPHDLDLEESKRWLFRVAINRFHENHRRRNRQTRILSSLAETDGRQNQADGLLYASRQEEQQAVHAALESLSPEVRLMMVMRYFLEFDSTEIGGILEFSPSTVRSHLRKARLQMAAELRKAGLGNAD